MRASVYQRFGGPIEIVDVPVPDPEPDGVVVRVEATGLCRSDWHGWMGHDPDITVPHVPGHELAGTIVEVGAAVRCWSAGDRVTVPFAAGCGACDPCRSGNQQVCLQQYQPGFTGWGSFAEYVALRYADGNLVSLPDSIDPAAAATLGCRFATAFRAVVDQGRVADSEWVAVHGCGGVGLAAVMVAAAFGGRVVAIDPNADARDFAASLGSELTMSDIDSRAALAELVEATDGGPHLSLDAIGDARVASRSIESLRPQGRHVQVGLLPDDSTALPMGRVIGRELEIIGSHGMPFQRYPQMIDMMLDGRLAPERLVTRRIALSGVQEALPAMGTVAGRGVTVIDSFAE